MTTEYALRAAVFLAQTQGKQTAQHVASVTKVPTHYMAKVMQLLVEAGLADSHRGPSGGYALTRPPSGITLLELVQAVEPIRRIRSCPLGVAEHCACLCPLHRAMDDLASIAEQRLGSTSLADIISQSVIPLGTQQRDQSPPE